MVYLRGRARRRISTGVQQGAIEIIGGAVLTAAGTAIANASGAKANLFGVMQYPTLGDGPGDLTTGGIYRCAVQSYTPAEMDAAIDLADTYGIVVVQQFQRGSAQWSTGQVFQSGVYWDKVLEFLPTSQGGTLTTAIYNKIMDRIANPTAQVGRCKIVNWVADEANRTDRFGDTFTPARLNWCGNVHKKFFPGATTCVRMGQATMAVGWGSPTVRPFIAGWPGMDYGWAQRGGQHNTQTLAAYYEAERSALVAPAVDLGRIAGFNLWDGGLVDAALDTVNNCWDTTGGSAISGANFGVIAGSQASNVGIPDGTLFQCGAIPANLNRCISAPAWIRRFADVGMIDPWTPFSAMFGYPSSGNGSGFALSYYVRQDYIDALNYCITKGLGRTVFNGWRTPKLGDATVTRAGV